MTASAPLAAFLGNVRLPRASAFQEAASQNRVPGQSAAATDSPAMLPALAFPAVLGSLVETDEPATAPKPAAAPKAPKDDTGPKAAKPAAAGPSLLVAATRGFVRNTQLFEKEPLAAALPASLAVAATTVTPPVAAARPEQPAAGTSTAPETTAQDLARVAAPESLWSQPAKLSPAPALLDDGLSAAPSPRAAAPGGYSAVGSSAVGSSAVGSSAVGSSAVGSKVTAPEAQYRSANGSNVSSGKATAGPTPDKEDAPSLPDPPAGPGPSLAACPAPPGNPPSPLRDSPRPATVPASPEVSLASPVSALLVDAAIPASASVPASAAIPVSAAEGLPAPRPREVFAGLSALPQPASKRSLIQDSPAPAAALPGGTPPTVQAAVPDRPADLTAAAHRALFPATTAGSTRHSAATAIQSPLPTGTLEPARYQARASAEPAVQPGGGKTMELAFGARLVPTALPVEAPAGDPPDAAPVPSAPPAHPGAAAPRNGAAPKPASMAAAPPDPATVQTGDSAEESSSPPPSPGKGEATAAERFRKSETVAASSWEASPASAAQVSPDAVYAPADGPTNALGEARHAVAAEPRPVAAPPRGADAEPARPPAAARNIQLDVNGGDRRVEVRLTERGGLVEVAVRTPDAHLASALREDLPALSSRLAESGFRAETWHPASPGASNGPGEWHKLAEPSPGGTTQDPNGRPRQNGGQPQGDSQPRQPKASEQQPDRKNPGKDFAWLMSSLR